MLRSFSVPIAKRKSSWYNDENDNGDYDYIKSKRSFIRNTFEENLGWDIHIHKNGALAALENSNEVKDIFPNKKGESAAVLFINKEVRRNINSGNLKKEDNDTVVMSNSEFDEFIIEVRRTHGHGFTKTLRDVSEQVFINIIRNFILKILDDSFDVISATDGKEAIDILESEEKRKNVKAVLLDLNMPNVNGFQVLEFFRENDLFRSIPISIITGVDDKESIDKAFKYPIVDILLKPFNERDVKKILEKTINSKL